MKHSRVRRLVPWVVVVGIFAAAAGYIRATVPGRDATAPRPAVSSAPASMSHGDGLSDSHDGYLLAPVMLPGERGAAVPLAFRILGPDRRPATEYESLLHLYLAREDLSVYQHLHPTLTGDTWTAAVAVPDGGVYRVYAEFIPKRAAGGPHPVVLGVPFIIAGDTNYVPVPPPAASAPAIGGAPTQGSQHFTVHRVDGTAPIAAGSPGSLRFQVRDAGGAPVAALEPYLGAYAHVSAFGVYDQSLTHLHPLGSAAQTAPADGVLTFVTQFAHRGEHRLFLQFQSAGTVHQAGFTVTVA